MPLQTNTRYKCCCGCCRATTGAVVVGILDIVVAAISLWQGLTGKFVLFTHVHSEYEQPMRQSALVGGGVFGTIGILVVFAVICRLPCLLIFHMVVDIAVLLAFGLLAALVIIIAFVATAEEHQMQSHESTRIIIFLCVLCAFALLQIWYFLIMLGAYRALSEEIDPARLRNGSAAATGAGVTTYSVVTNNGSHASSNGQQQGYYFSSDGTGDGSGVAGGHSAPPSYTPMLSTPNYYKQQPLYPATSPPMYG